MGNQEMNSGTLRCGMQASWLLGIAPASGPAWHSAWRALRLLRAELKLVTSVHLMVPKHRGLVRHALVICHSCFRNLQTGCFSSWQSEKTWELKWSSSLFSLFNSMSLNMSGSLPMTIILSSAQGIRDCKGEIAKNLSSSNTRVLHKAYGEYVV